MSAAQDYQGDKCWRRSVYFDFSTDGLRLQCIKSIGDALSSGRDTIFRPQNLESNLRVIPSSHEYLPAVVNSESVRKIHSQRYK